MSVQAMSFVFDYNRTSAAATRGEPPASVHERSVLVCLANYADKAGWNSYPLLTTVSDETGVGQSTVREVCQRLWAQGKIDAERRPGRERGTTGFFLRFRIVMDPGAIARKAASRQHLPAYEDDGLDTEGWPRSDDTPAERPETAAEDERGGDAREHTRDAPRGDQNGASAKPPAPGDFEPTEGAGKPPRSRHEGARKVLAPGAPIGNREPRTVEPSSSSSRDQSRDQRDGHDPHDDDRLSVVVSDACVLLADRDLEARLSAVHAEPIGDARSWLAEAYRRRLEHDGPDLTRLAQARPDLGPAELVELLSTAAPDGGDSPAPSGARTLPDGGLFLPGTGVVARPDWPHRLSDDERAASLEIARGIPRPNRPRAGTTSPDPGPDPTEA